MKKYILIIIINIMLGQDFIPSNNLILNQTQIFFKWPCSNIFCMKKKKTKKIEINSNKKNQELGQTKNSAKLVLFVFGIGPIIGIAIFLYTKGFFNSPTI